VYFKLYLRLKFLGFHNHFPHKLYVLLMFSCLICLDFVAHYIFFDLYGSIFCLDDLVDLLVLYLRFRNRREKIYRNMLYFL
jgi:hypothetical protein